MTSVNSRSRILMNAYLNRVDLKHIRKGTKAMRAAGEEYLPKHSGESEEQYIARLKSSVLHNITSRIIDVLTARPFKKMAFIQSKDEDIMNLNSNFDGTGESFTDFARLFFQEGLWDSQAHAFVDFSQADVDVSGSPIYNPNKKHRVRVLNNDNILDARHNTESGELTYLRFKDYEQKEVQYDVEDVEIVWEFKKIAGKVLYTKHKEYVVGKDKETSFSSDEWKEFSLKYIPLVSFYPKPAKQKFNPNLIFQDMAELNITHWQSYSEQRNALKFARIPILFFTGINAGDQELKLGSAHSMASTNTDADGKYIETAGTAIKDGRDDVLDLEQKMQALGFELLAKRQGVQTATGASLDMESTNSMLGCFAVALKEALDKITMIICDWYSIRQPEFEISMETNFQVDYNDEKIRTLLAIWTNGGIKTDAFLKEMKKHGVLHDDADIDTIIGIAGLNEQF